MTPELVLADHSGGWARKRENGNPECWGAYRHTQTGQSVHLYRGKRNRVRFYDGSGRQVGPEQSNVAPGVAWALFNGYLYHKETP